MSFSPNRSELLNRARADLRAGVPIILGSSLVFSAETLTPDRLTSLQISHSDVFLAITRWRAKTLKARVYDDSLARIRMPTDAPIDWVHALADPADDLDRPMKGPLESLRGGNVDDVAIALQILKDARLLPAAVMATIVEPQSFAQQHSLTFLDTSAGLDGALLTPTDLEAIVSARLPLSVSEQGRLHVFRPEDGGEEHYAVEIGQPSRQQPVLTRLHSACFTGDLLGSLKCDCGPQLRGALAQMGAEASGILLYLNQEGRGIGLANKMRAYSLQDQGFDTVEANHRLGFEDDERDFRIGSEILKRLGFRSVRLMTNNPNKIEIMRSHGIEVEERVPLRVGKTEHNADYLRIKATKSGHLL